MSMDAETFMRLLLSENEEIGAMQMQMKRDDQKRFERQVLDDLDDLPITSDDLND